MTQKMLPPTQSDIDEAVLDGVQLVQEMGFQLDAETAKKVAGRKVVLLNHLSIFSLVLLNSEPIIDGWKRSA
jgi:hypothetical protein